MRKSAIAVAIFLALTGAILGAGGGSSTDEMASNFLAPPDSAKPWAYWVWLNGNVTKEGITRDLEEMKQKGINGVLIFQAGDRGTPSGVSFLSPEWHEMFQHTLRECARLNMSVSMGLCDGWNAGGPWITQDQSNKKLVYSELQVDGAKQLDWLLPLPPVLDNYYHDVAVLAIPEKPTRPVTPALVTASSTLEGYVGEWNFYPQDAVDGDPATYWSSEKKALNPSDPMWLEFDYTDPLPASGIYVHPGPASGPRECEVQFSADGEKFTSVAHFTLEKGQGKRVDFPTVSSRHFRLVMTSAYATPVQVAEAILLRQGDQPILRHGIKWWWFKSGNRAFWDYPRQGPAALDEEYVQDGAVDYRLKDVVNLTAALDADGRLKWKVPPGRWTILRFGYTLLGQRIRGSSRDVARGYEADMLDRAGIESHIEHAATPILADVAATGTHVLNYLHIDSYELGANFRGQQPQWSRAFPEEFQKHRGYDLTPYLPTLAGRIADSRELTDRFLFDIRWTIGDLMAEQFWIPFGELAHQRGLKIESETGYGSYPYPHIDSLRCAGNNDLPMGEFWFGTDLMSQLNNWGNVIRTEASAAHIYNRPVVMAESFTSWMHWEEYPESLKPAGDEEFLDGLNRMAFHQYTAQPMLDMKPGWQYGAGTHFDRNITWWEEARGFFQYLARCQYLLQKGQFQADALYFYGEGVSKFVPSQQYLRPALPQGYNFDAINADLVMHGLAIDHGRWTLPSGMSYRVLVLPQGGVMSAAVLQRIRELVEQGGVVAGPKPQRAPGLKDYPHSNAALKTLAEDMWGGLDGIKVKAKGLGKGRIYAVTSLGEVFGQENIAPDFAFHSKAPGTELGFVHRSTDDSEVYANTEVYFISNRKDRDEAAECAFRVTGKLPEIWDPVTGESWTAGRFKQGEGVTTVPLEFAPYGSLFVVFRQRISTAVMGIGQNFPVYSPVAQVEGPWTVSFDPKWGGPASVEIAKLQSWTTRPEDGIKYYSGTATYRKAFDLPPALQSAHGKLALDLGDVKYAAEVRLNGKDLGPLWTKPFRVDITYAVKSTGNVLEIDVANLWPNRIIGDSRLPPDQRYTKTNIVYTVDTPLWESGLLGPVALELMTNDEQPPRPGQQTSVSILPQELTLSEAEAKHMFPAAARKTDSVDCFFGLAPHISMSMVVQRCGRPDEDVGSGVYIFVWHLEDGSTVSISTPTLDMIQDIRYTLPSGKSSSILQRK
jgi:hypothetical protein